MSRQAYLAVIETGVTDMDSELWGLAGGAVFLVAAAYGFLKVMWFMFAAMQLAGA